MKPVRGQEFYLRAVETRNSVVRISLQEANGWAILPSSLKRPDGTPRFNLNFPKHLIPDPGAVHLVVNELREFRDDIPAREQFLAIQPILVSADLQKSHTLILVVSFHFQSLLPSINELLFRNVPLNSSDGLGYVV